MLVHSLIQINTFMENKNYTLLDFFGRKKDESNLKQLHSKEVIGGLKKQLNEECQKHEWKVVWKSIIDHMDKLLEINIVEIMMRPWKNYGGLAKYKDAEKYPPDRTYIVPLLEHTITSSHNPQIVVELEPLFKTTIPVDITIELLLKGFALEIQAGRIKKIHTGECKGSGLVQCMNVTLLRKELEAFSLPGIIDLGEGIRIGKGSTESINVVKNTA